MANQYDSKSIRQTNGEIVMQALREINEPTTITNIVKFVAQMQDVQPGEIKEPVKKVLEKGVEYGFLMKRGAKYAVEIYDGASDDDPEERASRRRPSRSRSGSRKRSRSRRRKSPSRRRKSRSRKR